MCVSSQTAANWKTRLLFEELIAHLCHQEELERKQEALLRFTTPLTDDRKEGRWRERRKFMKRRSRCCLTPSSQVRLLMSGSRRAFANSCSASLGTSGGGREENAAEASLLLNLLLSFCFQPTLHSSGFFWCSFTANTFS